MTMDIYLLLHQKTIGIVQSLDMKEWNHFRVYISRCRICWRRLVKSARRRWGQKTLWWPVYNCLWKKSSMPVSIKYIDYFKPNQNINSDVGKVLIYLNHMFLKVLYIRLRCPAVLFKEISGRKKRRK